MSCHLIYKKNSQVALKIEATEGVAESLSAADADILAYDPTFQIETVRYTRSPARGTMSRLPAVVGRRTGKATFAVDVAGSGDPEVLPAWVKALKCCGWQEAATTAGFDLTPDSTCPPSATIAVLHKGIKHLIYGARGNAKFEGDSQNGGPGKITFEFEGVYGGTLDADLFDGDEYDAVVPPSFTSLGMTLMGNDLSIATFANFSFDCGNQIQVVPDANAESGVAFYIIGDRTLVGSIDPNLVEVSEFDVYGLLVDGTTGTLACQLGNVAGNVIRFSAPSVQISNVKTQARGDIIVAGLDLDFVTDNADDEFTISLE